MPGRALGVATSQSCGETLGFPYVSTSVSQHVFIATIACVITSVAYRIRVASTSGTVTVVKCASGTAPASGTAITAALDLGSTPTADTTFTPALIPGNNNVNVNLNAGDSIALVFAGTLTSGVGLMQVFVEPLN
jgi:pyruvate/oxaloacetate carboxyltransferase